MGIKVANNAFATLAAGITNSATSITVASGQGARFPSLGAGDYFYATLINTSNQLEIVKCTARSGDVLTVTRGQESTTARSYDVGDRIEIRITAATFEDATAIYNVPSGTTGYFGMPAGTTAQRPVSPPAGASRYNSDTGSLEFFDGTDWISTNLIPTVNSVTGTIFAGAASTLTLSVTNATETITVRFSEGGSTLADVAGVTVTSGSASVTVPSAVFNRPAATVIAVSVINQDNTPSSNAINRTVQALPTGGTITTSGGFRIHTFTSSGNFVVPSGLSLTNVEYLVVAGGGGGGSGYVGGGGGAGGYRCSVPSESSGGGASAEARLALSANTYTVTVGGGGAGGQSSQRGVSGSNSVFGSITSSGGGGGGQYQSSNQNGLSGGSGGGGSGETAGAGGSGTSGQGRAGGNGTSGGGGVSAGGGGGGASTTGGNASGATAGNGGAGVSSSISGTSVARGGGGGGGADQRNGSSVAGTGGTGGGGNGTRGSSQAPSGTANTGGGGGGGGEPANAPGGNGGSGIVIVRYQL